MRCVSDQLFLSLTSLSGPRRLSNIIDFKGFILVRDRLIINNLDIIVLLLKILDGLGILTLQRRLDTWALIVNGSPSALVTCLS